MNNGSLYNAKFIFGERNSIEKIQSIAQHFLLTKSTTFTTSTTNNIPEESEDEHEPRRAGDVPSKITLITAASSPCDVMKYPLLPSRNAAHTSNCYYYGESKLGRRKYNNDTCYDVKLLVLNDNTSELGKYGTSTRTYNADAAAIRSDMLMDYLELGDLHIIGSIPTTTIQRYTRGWLARTKLSLAKNERTISIQRCIRGWLVRIHLEKLNNSAFAKKSQQDNQRDNVTGNFQKPLLRTSFVQNMKLKFEQQKLQKQREIGPPIIPDEERPSFRNVLSKYQKAIVKNERVSLIPEQERPSFQHVLSRYKNAIRKSSSSSLFEEEKKSVEKDYYMSNINKPFNSEFSSCSQRYLKHTWSNSTTQVESYSEEECCSNADDLNDDFESTMPFPLSNVDCLKPFVVAEFMQSELRDIQYDSATIIQSHVRRWLVWNRYHYSSHHSSFLGSKAYIESLIRSSGIVAGMTTFKSSCFPNRLKNFIVFTRFSFLWGSSTQNKKVTYLSREYHNYSLLNKYDNGVQQVFREYCTELLHYILHQQQGGTNDISHPAKKDEGKSILELFIVGATWTFFRAGVLEYIESVRTKAVNACMTRIQAFVRSWLVRIRKQTEIEIKNNSIILQQQCQQNQKGNERHEKKGSDILQNIANETIARLTLKDDQFQCKKDEIDDAHEGGKLSKLNGKAELLRTYVHLMGKSRALDKVRNESLLEVSERIEHAQKMQRRYKCKLDILKTRKAAAEAATETIVEENERMIDSLRDGNCKLHQRQTEVQSFMSSLSTEIQELVDNQKATSNQYATSHPEHVDLMWKNYHLQTELDKRMELRTEFVETIEEWNELLWTKASQRWEKQQALYSMIVLIQSNMRKSRRNPIVRRANVIALKCESKAKLQMKALEAEYGPPEDVQSHGTVSTDSETDSVSTSYSG